MPSGHQVVPQDALKSYAAQPDSKGSLTARPASPARGFSGDVAHRIEQHEGLFISMEAVTFFFFKHSIQSSRESEEAISSQFWPETLPSTAQEVSLCPLHGSQLAGLSWLPPLPQASPGAFPVAPGSLQACEVWAPMEAGRGSSLSGPSCPLRASHWGSPQGPPLPCACQDPHALHQTRLLSTGGERV